MSTKTAPRIVRMPFNTHREARAIARFRNNPPRPRRRWWHWLTDPITSDPLHGATMAAAEIRRQDEENRTLGAVLAAIILASLVVWFLAGGVA